MKRTDKLTNFIAFLLFAAFVVYAGAYAVRALKGTTVTAEAVAAEVRPGGVASGIVVREETVLTSSEEYIDITAREGSKVAAGSQLAIAMDSEAALEHANRVHALEQEISRITIALTELDSAEDLTGRDEALRGAVDGIATSIARHELAGMDGDILNLRSLLFPESTSGTTRAELRELERELKSLQTKHEDNSRVLTSEIGGVFSTMVDGYESLTPKDLENLTPSVLLSLRDRNVQPSTKAYGKLVSSFRWYFASVMSEADAETLVVGHSAILNFGRYYGADIRATVSSISAPESGNVCVVFSCGSALSDTLAMRIVSADVVFETYSGIRVPAQALRFDSDSETNYVWCITAMQLERKDVSVLYQDEDFAIIAYTNSPSALREGNTVVVNGNDLYEGKVME